MFALSQFVVSQGNRCIWLIWGTARLRGQAEGDETHSAALAVSLC